MAAQDDVTQVGRQVGVFAHFRPAAVDVPVVRAYVGAIVTTL